MNFIKWFINTFSKIKLNPVKKDVPVQIPEPVISIAEISQQANLLKPIKDFPGKITQHFGDPWSANLKKQHTGLDIAIPAGTEVYAIADGEIMATGLLDKSGSWAKYIDLQHDSGGLCSAYLHVDPLVNVGQKVRAGDVIARTANISAKHLHFNIWNGSYTKLTHRGALPFPEHTSPTTDPAFPHKFIDPLSIPFV